MAEKLTQELAYESEASQAGTPEFVKEFTSQGTWSIQDNKGADEVTLERTFGNETVRLMFSVADLDATPESEVELEGENAESEPAAESATSSPLRVAITVIKRGTSGAMNVDAVCQDGAFLVENVSFYADSETGTALTAEADWKRRGLYLGPTFENLDPAVQDEFERFLEERGINESLALFVPDYAEYKEQTVSPRNFGPFPDFLYANRHVRNTFAGLKVSESSLRLKPLNCLIPALLSLCRHDLSISLIHIMALMLASVFHLDRITCCSDPVPYLGYYLLPRGRTLHLQL